MSETAEEIRERLQRVRTRGSVELNELDQAVKRLKDWREHYKSHPFVAVGLALAAGYMVVPSRDKRKADGRSRHESRRTDDTRDTGEVATAASSAVATGLIGGVIADFAKNAFRRWALSQVSQRFSTFGGSPAHSQMKGDRGERHERRFS